MPAATMDRTESKRMVGVNKTRVELDSERLVLPTKLFVREERRTSRVGARRKAARLAESTYDNRGDLRC